MAWCGWYTNELICPVKACLPPVMTCIFVTDAHHAELRIISRMTRARRKLVTRLMAVVWDSRDAHALAQVADLLHRCMDATSWKACRVGLYEMAAIIDEVKTGSYDQI